MNSWPIQFLRSLANAREIVIFDNPGVGSSTVLDEEAVEITIPGMANATVALIDALGLQEPDIIGL